MRDFLGKKGFTLAEVLITLGIIGVVAAMTLPTLITNVQKQTLAVATRKFHSNLSNAVQLYMADEGTNDLRYSDLCIQDNGASESKVQKAIDDFIREHFNVVKECDFANVDQCFAKEYRNYTNNGSTYLGSNFLGGNTFVIADGAVLTIVSGDWNGEGGQPLTVYVDVNGQKGPNVVGYDLWNMAIYYDGTVDESNGAGPEARNNGTLKQKREDEFKWRCGQTYGGCFGHFLNNNYKFDY